MMENTIRSLQQEIIDFEITSTADLESFRLRYTVRKGLIAALFGQLKMVDPADKPRIGQLLNQLKLTADAKLTEAEERLASTGSSDSKKGIDLTLPGRRYFTGSEHPVQKVLGEMKQIFSAMGFGIATGPELELDRYNFDLLNFPPGHPARDMQDTFFVTSGNPGSDVLLRTHTSPGAGESHARPETADTGNMPRKGLPQRSHQLPKLLRLPPARRALHRQEGLLC